MSIKTKKGAPDKAPKKTQSYQEDKGIHDFNASGKFEFFSTYPITPLSFINQSNYRNYNILVAKKLNCVNSSIFFSELIEKHDYHLERGELINDPKCGPGWFYHTIEACQNRTMLGRKAQDSARAHLESHQLIETKIFGLPARRHFRLNHIKIYELMGFSNNYCSMSKKSKLDCSKRTNYDVPKEQADSLYIYNTKEEPKNRDMQPKVASSSSRKKIKEIHEEVSDRVCVTPTQHASLIKKSNNNPDLVKQWYERLSTWKISKGIIGGSSDYQSICKWVIEAVQNESKKEEKVSDQVKLDQSFAEKIWNMFKGRNDIQLGYKYLEFVNGPTVAQFQFGEKDFKKNCLIQLSKRKLNITDI